MPKFTINIPNNNPTDTINFLKDVLREIEKNPQTLTDFIHGEEASQNISQWVLVNNAGHPVEPCTLHTLDETYGYQTSATKNLCWVKPQFLGRTPILATVKSDDSVVSRTIDIRPWLLESDAGSIEEALSDPMWSEATDRVFLDLEDREPGCRDLSNYLGLHPTTINGDPVGYSVEIHTPTLGLLFLKDERRDVFDKIADQIHW